MAYKADAASKLERNNDAFLKHVGVRIRNARRLAGMTQSQLANAIDVKQPYIVAVEAGENLTLRSLARISAVLNVQPATLLSEGELVARLDAASPELMESLILQAARDGELLFKLLLRLQEMLSERRNSDPSGENITPG